MSQVLNQSLNLLVVDDDELDRMSVRRMLRTSDSSIKVEEADNASSALKLLRETSFDCAIIDYQLPGTDGLGLLKQIRTLDTSLPVIMMTGQRDERLIVDLMKAGATDYLSKSIASPDSLLLSVRNAIRVQRAEQASHESESRFRTMADSAPVLLWMSDAEGRRQFFNQSWLRFTGRTRQQEADNGWQAAIHSEDLDRYLAVYRAGLTRQQAFDIEYRLRRNDGEYRWLLESSVPRLTDDGTLVGFIGSGVDITERKRAERQLEERTHQALLGADIGVILTSTDPLQKKLQRCTESMVRHIDAAFAGIWTINDETSVLELQASSGLYTNLDDSHSRALVGQFKIDKIARDNEPHLTNDLTTDALVDHEWAAKAKLLAFAGFPLGTQDKVVGVVAMFSRHTLSISIMGTLGAIADELALAIQQARITTENERLYQQAQDAIQVREVFLSVASHELKTPLTSLMSNVQLLMMRVAREKSLNERDTHTLSVVSQQAVRLNKMIGALLDISRLENGKLTILKEPMDLGVLVARLVEETRPTLDNHTIEFTEFVGPLPLDADELRLEQVIQNLIQNAIKYSPKGGNIKVTVGVESDFACVSVADQGIGIPQDVLPQLFDRFFRAPNVHERNISGLGLGLYVVKEIIDLHDGTISVSTVEGQGSTFTIRLPMRHAVNAGA